MRIKPFILCAFALVVKAATPNRLHGDKTACAYLDKLYPDQVFFPHTDGYKYETRTQIWAASNVKDPACVFVPQDADEVAFAVTIFTFTKTKFAVRGGGHVPIAGANSIDAPGVLLGLSNMTTMHLCDETNVLSVGPGHRWQDVYDYLEPQGLMVVGGRVGQIGVPGLLLGGGLSFYSAQHGFASDNVVKYECVLADGTVAEITADNEYSDLFWALKAGGNSFCIVTRFDLRTFSSPEVYIGTETYAPYFSSKFLDAVNYFARDGALDTKAALIPTVITVPATNTTTYRALQFYDSSDNVPQTWGNFTLPHMAAAYSDYRRRPLAEYLREDTELVPSPLRRVWRTFTSLVSRPTLTIIHSYFVSMTTDHLASHTGVTASITFQPVTADFVRHGQENGGSPQGIVIDLDPLFITVIQLACETGEEYAVLQDFAELFYNGVTEALAEAGLLVNYFSMNHAGEGQAVFQSYGSENLARLKEIREKYDPRKVYSALMPGGWKVLDA